MKNGKLSCAEVETLPSSKVYLDLWRRHKTGFASFAVPDLFFKRLVRGDFLLLRNRFRLKTLRLNRGDRAILMATLFVPGQDWLKQNSTASLKPVTALGAFAYDRTIQAEEAEHFWNWFTDRYGHLDPVGPLNAHYYLGFSLAPPQADGSRIGFQTAAPHLEQERVFGRFTQRTPLRRFYSFETPLNPERIRELEDDLAEPKNGIRIRPFQLTRARRDLGIMNELVNRSFTEHYGFVPLTEEENWDISRWSLSFLSRSHFLFVEVDGKPVGFCFGMKDFNQILRNDSDVLNVPRVLFAGAGRTVRRARMIHKGVLPEYQGQGLVNQARHRILLSFAKAGIQTVENSYVDEGNVRSLRNVKSTGAEPLHEFRLFRFSAE